MKQLKVLSILLLTVMMMPFMTSCSESAKLEKAAKAQMEATFKEMARDPYQILRRFIVMTLCVFFTVIFLQKMGSEQKSRTNVSISSFIVTARTMNHTWR